MDKNSICSMLARVVDRRQEPVRNAKIHVRQKEHDFLLGCGAFDSINLTSPGEDADVDFYRDRMEKRLALKETELENVTRIIL